MKIYLAGPLFTMAERKFNTALAWALRDHGHEVWLPQENEPRVEGVSGKELALEIYKKDIEGIDWAEVVVANMDGPDPDSGTAFECGFANRGFKPVIAFRTDFRQAGDAGDTPFNLMLAASAHHVIHVNAMQCGVPELGAAIRAALVKL